MYKTNLNVLKQGYFPVKTHPTNLFHNIKQLGRNIKYACQRVTRGYADSDWWNLDSFYISLIIETLKDFKANHHGVPGPYVNEKLPDNGAARYEFEIQQVINCLNNACEETYDVELEKAGYSTEAYKEIERKMKMSFKDGWDRLGKLFPSLWD